MARLFGFTLLLAMTVLVWTALNGNDPVLGQHQEELTGRPRAGLLPQPLQGVLTAFRHQEQSGTAAPSSVQQSCTVNCSATVPATGVVNSQISFQTTATPTGCATTPTYEWNFGDGSARSTQQNPGYAYPNAGTYQWSVRTTYAGGSMTISTIAGGFGEGNAARLATIRDVTLMARDPQGRGLYIADSIGDVVYIRFINTGTASATIAGVTIAPGTIRVVAGGGASLSDDVAVLNADLVTPTGLATSPTGELLYVINPIDGVLRAINVGTTAQTVLGTPLPPGQIRTIASGLNSGINAIAVHPTDGSVMVADATTAINKVLRIDAAGGVTTFAGAGGTSQPTDGFSAGPATSVKLLLPRAIRFDSSGNLLISDTGHGRIIRVDSAGNAALFYQFGVGTTSPNPYPSGMAFFAGNLFTANGNQQTVTRVSPSTFATVAGIAGAACSFAADNNCGDGGPGVAAGLYLLNSTAEVPLAAIEGDSGGLFIADQGTLKKGRVRYLNLSGTAVTIAGRTVAAGAIETIAGNGLDYPYDGGLATSSTFSSPTGIAMDANGNLWIADTLSSLLRFVNRSSAPVTIFPGTSSERVVPAGAIITVNSDRTGGQANGPVKNAGFADPQGLFVTSQGIYIVDSKAGPSVPPATATSRRTSLVRFINTTSSPITFYAGTGNSVTIDPGSIARIIGGGEGTKGDGGPALSAVLIGASDVVVTANGTIYVTDVGQKSVRRVVPSTGTITSLTVAAAQYTGLGLDPTGRLYLANYEGSLILRETAAGSGSFATMASALTRARDVAVDASGTAYVTVSPAARVSGNHQLVQVSPTGTATVIAGGNPGFGGDGGPATAAQIRISPSELVVGTGTTNQLPETVGIIVGQNGEVLFTDSNNNRIRRLAQSSVVCESTGTITIAGTNPVPQLTTLSPATALQNSGAFTLTVTGANFVTGAEVRWNGAARPTVFVSATQLTAGISATDLATAGTASVTVNNPAPGGGLSNTASFTVTAPNPLPQLTSLSPATAVQGGAAFTLTVNGTGFVSGAIVRWDGQNRTTSFVSATQLTAQILASDIVGIGTATVTVVNPTPGGGISNSLAFSITGVSSAAPTISALTPGQVIAGGPDFTLTVTGTGFVSGAQLRINGNARTTTFVSATSLTATIPAEDTPAARTLAVTVVNPGSPASNSLSLPVYDRVTSVSAASYATGAQAPNSILAAFAANLAKGVEISNTVPLPTTLLGTRVVVRDSAGVSRDQSLFFVAPQQINFHLHPETAAGVATVTVYIDSAIVALGEIQVGQLSPAIFTQNATGDGVPAAYGLRVRGSEVTPVTLLAYDAGLARWITTPIDLGPEGDVVYLVLFGSGFRSNGGLGSISVRIGSQEVTPLYAGEAPGFVGLDQMNIGPIPRALIGAGVVNLTVTIGGKIANQSKNVQLQFK